MERDDDRVNRHMTPNRRIAGYYGLGFLSTVWLTLQGWPWSAPLLWPAAALAGVTAGYLLGVPVYGKREGRLPRITRWLFAPTLLGQQASLWHYRRRCTPYDEAQPGLLMGRLLSPVEAEGLRRQGVTAVLDLTAEFSEHAVLRGLNYRNLPLLDLTAPTPSALHEAVRFIRDQLAAGGKVYVHCKVGYSRTATVVGAYLLTSGQCPTVEAVVATLGRVRPGMVVRPEAVRALSDFAGGQRPYAKQGFHI